MDLLDEIIEELDLLRRFAVDTDERLNGFERGLEALADSTNVREIVLEQLRAIHTIKGTAATLALLEVMDAAHDLEDQLIDVRDGNCLLDASRITQLREQSNAIRRLSWQAATDESKSKRRRTRDRTDSKPAARAGLSLRGVATPQLSSPTNFAHRVVTDSELRQSGTRGLRQDRHRVTDIPRACLRFQSRSMAVTSTAQVHRTTTVSGFAGAASAVTVKTQPTVRQQLFGDLNRLIDQLPSVQQQIEKYCRSTESGKLQLAFRWLDFIHGQMRKKLRQLDGEVGPDQARNLSTTSHVAVSDASEDRTRNSNSPARDADDASASGPLVSPECEMIGSAWRTLPTLVRMLAASCGKQVRLEIQGTETPLAKRLIPVVHATLTHLFRNAVDHGVESPEIRAARGKSLMATISLRASRSKDQMLIELRDDGRGIDRERVVQQALRLGLVSEQEAARMSDHDQMQLIFHPGLSTAARVTNLSGRGIGMDAARAAIEGAGGTVSVQSVADQGTTIQLRLPLAGITVA